MSASLYERLGGEGAVMAAVDRFYEKVLADEKTRPFFAGIDMHAQIQKQIAFMTRAFGGPAQNQGRDLAVAHAKLVKERGLSDVHFDAVVCFARRSQIDSVAFAPRRTMHDRATRDAERPAEGFLLRPRRPTLMREAIDDGQIEASV